MAIIKPDMTPAQACRLLARIWGAGVEGVEAVGRGEVSAGFYFRHRGRDLVARFNRSPAGFEVDRYAAAAFGGTVPVPRVLALGEADGLWYAVAERLPGQPLQAVPWPWPASVTDALVGTLRGLERIDTGGTTGAGPVGPDGRGRFSSWGEYLTFLFSDRETGFWAAWHDLFTTTFLDRDLFDRTLARMRALVPLCGRPRAVVHGDFHLGNILTDGRTVTGVVDWAELMYGDPLYDVATFHFWNPQLELPAAYAAQQDAPGPNRPERLLCYHLSLGLDGLRFYAKVGRRQAYEATVRRLQSPPA